MNFNNFLSLHFYDFIPERTYMRKPTRIRLHGEMLNLSPRRGSVMVSVIDTYIQEWILVLFTIIIFYYFEYSLV